MAVGTNSSGKKEKQLYDLIKELDNSVPDKDEIGALIGYSVVRSLFAFNTKSGSDEEIMFEEVKIIRSGIEKAVESCRETDCFMTICEMNDAVENLKINAAKGEYEGKSSLLKMIVGGFAAANRNYEDLLRRSGLKIAEFAREKGRQEGNKNALNNEYQIVKRAFGYRVD